jgi:hypothetical protein
MEQLATKMEQLAELKRDNSHSWGPTPYPTLAPTTASPTSGPTTPNFAPDAKSHCVSFGCTYRISNLCTGLEYEVPTRPTYLHQRNGYFRLRHPGWEAVVGNMRMPTKISSERGERCVVLGAACEGMRRPQNWAVEEKISMQPKPRQN